LRTAVSSAAKSDHDIAAMAEKVEQFVSLDPVAIDAFASAPPRAGPKDTQNPPELLPAGCLLSFAPA
jgi:hypothetical protein